MEYSAIGYFFNSVKLNVALIFPQTFVHFFHRILLHVSNTLLTQFPIINPAAPPPPSLTTHSLPEHMNCLILLMVTLWPVGGVEMGLRNKSSTAPSHLHRPSYQPQPIENPTALVCFASPTQHPQPATHQNENYKNSYVPDRELKLPSLLRKSFRIFA